MTDIWFALAGAILQAHASDAVTQEPVMLVAIKTGKLKVPVGRLGSSEVLVGREGLFVEVGEYFGE